MTTTEQVRKIVNERRQKLAADAGFRKLQKFYRMKSEQGAVLRKDYGLPLLDTIGREIYGILAPGKGKNKNDCNY